MAEMKTDVRDFLQQLAAHLKETPAAVPQRFHDNVKKQNELMAKTFKSARFAYFIVGREGAYRKGKSYEQGEVIKITLDELPSSSWKPTTKGGIQAAEAVTAQREAEAAELAGMSEAPEDEADDLEPEAGDDSDDVDPDADADTDADVDQSAPTPPAAPAKKPAARPAAKPKPAAPAKKKNRAADRDVV